MEVKGHEVKNDIKHNLVFIPKNLGHIVSVLCPSANIWIAEKKDDRYGNYLIAKYTRFQDANVSFNKNFPLHKGLDYS